MAWQFYSDAAKQVIATSAPELGWSPEAKQMIAGWVQQLGWTKPPAGSEKQAAPVAQTAPAAPSFDPEQVQRMARDLATLRQTVEQLAAGQDQVTRGRRRGDPCEDHPSASSAATHRCPRAQAHADSAAHGAGTNTTAPTASPINSARGCGRHICMWALAS